MTTDEIEFLDDPHEYRFGAVVLPSVTQVIGAVLGDGEFSRIDPEVLERARLRGKLVHQACHALDEDDLDVDAWQEFDRRRLERGEEAILPRVLSYQMWRDASGFIPLDNEKIVADRQLGVAGTLDKKGILYGKNTIVDLKSGPIHPECGIQTAGYAILDGDVACKRYGLRLIPNKMAKPEQFDDPFDIATFRSIVGVYHWMAKHGRL